MTALRGWALRRLSPRGATGPGVSEMGADLCGDLAYNITGSEGMDKELELYREHSSQVKRRRILQFESEALDTPIFKI
ncbi:hypothetical protein CASFOL_004773 [Castilleja foliolosa]|uniref:Uncharacterized protein n=1 Tax=Castilleja foliolosa TaxID=1961234 RepID=A0ABD3EBK8_9LAMI